MDLGISGQVAVVTGSGGGMGRAIALLLAGEGARVGIADLNESAAKKVAAEIQSGGGLSAAVKVDVADRTSVEAGFAAIVRTLGPIDILVNNAGIAALTPISQIVESEWDRIYAVNTKGTLFCCQAVMESMRKRKSGRIINISSQTAKTGGRQPYSHYSSSKSAVWTFTMALAHDLSPYGVTVNAVAPGSIEGTDFLPQMAIPTDPAEIAKMIPLGRRGTPEDVANVIAFLASKKASFITGELIDVNGGALMD